MHAIYLYNKLTKDSLKYGTNGYLILNYNSNYLVHSWITTCIIYLFALEYARLVLCIYREFIGL